MIAEANSHCSEACGEQGLSDASCPDFVEVHFGRDCVESRSVFLVKARAAA